jgi:8-oxo-dGTP diphosphatase
MESEGKGGHQEKNLDQYGRPYPPKAGKYHVPGVTTDAVCVREKAGKKEILLVTRKGPAEKGKLALPGGFIEYNEPPQECVLRELLEETGVKGSNPKLIDVFGNPLRDPRRHVITMAYLVEVPPDCQPKGDDDAEHADFYRLDEILKKDKIAFDHLDIIKRYVELFP